MIGCRLLCTSGLNIHRDTKLSVPSTGTFSPETSTGPPIISSCHQCQSIKSPPVIYRTTHCHRGIICCRCNAQVSPAYLCPLKDRVLLYIDGERHDQLYIYNQMKDLSPEPNEQYIYNSLTAHTPPTPPSTTRLTVNIIILNLPCAFTSPRYDLPIGVKKHPNQIRRLPLGSLPECWE